MESSCKRRTGFFKGKLMKSLYRAAAAPPVKPITDYSSEDSPQTLYHLHLHHHHQQPKEKLVPYNPNSIIIVNQEKAAPMVKPKVSYYYGRVDTDECVDIKAANYISCVQERFKLVDSEWNKLSSS